MVTLAVDVGFGRTKGLSSTGKRIEFPSVVGEFLPVRFSSGMEDKALTSRLALDYAGKKYYVGEAALKQSTPQATIDKERTVTKEGLVLLMAALSYLVERNSEPVRIVVGLPVTHYETLKSKYVSAIRGTHLPYVLNPAGEIEKRLFFRVEEAKVLPQPFGTLFNCLLNDKGDLEDPELAAGKIGIVDIGYNTLDLARSDALEFINPSSTSFSGLGMFSAFQALSNKLYQDFEVEVPPERLEPVILTGQIQISGKVVPVVKQTQEIFQATAEQIASRIKSVWPDRWELDRILITGGGALALGPHLVNILGDTTQVVNSPVFANVSGYLKFARRAWRE